MSAFGICFVKRESRVWGFEPRRHSVSGVHTAGSCGLFSWRVRSLGYDGGMSSRKLACSSLSELRRDSGPRPDQLAGSLQSSAWAAGMFRPSAVAVGAADGWRSGTVKSHLHKQSDLD